MLCTVTPEFADQHLQSVRHLLCGPFAKVHKDTAVVIESSLIIANKIKGLMLALTIIGRLPRTLLTRVTRGLSTSTTAMTITITRPIATMFGA
ncbi:MAG: Unknown protein [uncultured Sulfurovum sp.]|uniref:Uncharacterized protein n=1 Tax=uncultured Sulfurovum sp. TaxID=269237 RepID=A0A6S6TN16_9BACT|nr:MAG: Unknown protein [uncultured Sulfurovum sp.]